MSRVMELEEQIKKLQEEKSKIYSEERKAALADIKEKIATFEFSAKELGIKLPKAVAGKAEKVEKATTKKAAKKTAKKSRKSSGQYFDLDGDHVPVKSGRVPPKVVAFAEAKGVTAASLKRNADGSPFVK